MLIVEDDVMIAMLIEQVLEDEGCQIVGLATTVEAALRQIERDPPDAVTLDGNLNGELSAPVARALNERGIPYLLVTGYVETMIADPTFGQAPYLAKPFTPLALVRAAATHLC